MNVTTKHERITAITNDAWAYLAREGWKPSMASIDAIGDTIIARKGRIVMFCCIGKTDRQALQLEPAYAANVRYVGVKSVDRIAQEINCLAVQAVRAPKVIEEARA